MGALERGCGLAEPVAVEEVVGFGRAFNGNEIVMFLERGRRFAGVAGGWVGEDGWSSGCRVGGRCGW